MPYRVVPSPRQSELQQLASWFHQDWNLVFPDFYTGLRMYLDNLPAGRRAALGSELRRFMEQNQGASAKALKRLWLRLGAQGWQANLDIRDTLDAFWRIIESKQ